MLSFARLEQQLVLDEGFRSHPYRDSIGVWTIGYGVTVVDGRPVTKSTPAMTMGQARQLLRAGIFNALLDCEKTFPNFAALDGVRQEVLANMAYNLGGPKLRQFKRMRAAVERFDFPEWADEMVDSKWYRQVGARSKRLVKAVRDGKWPA